jgi:hypothetical protein
MEAIVYIIAASVAVVAVTCAVLLVHEAYKKIFKQ